MRSLFKTAVVLLLSAGTAKSLYFTETRIDTAQGGWGFMVVSFHPAGDIDGDGDKDIYCNTWFLSPPTLRWYRNQGSGNFTKEYITGIGMYGYALRDFTGDNRPDLITLDFVGNLNYYNVFFYRNTGGSFSSGTNIDPGAAGPNHCDAADADGDGDLDLVVSHRITEFAAYRNDGAGNFTKVSVYLFYAYGENEGVCWVDVEGDGDKDVVGCHWGAGWVRWFRNNNWSFSLGGAVTSSISYPHGLHGADFDRDGDQDILVVSGASNDNGGGDARIYLNNGSGSFTELYVGPVDRGGAGMLYDVDVDGDMDVVVSGSSTMVWPTSGEIAWFENTGSGFVKHNLTSEASYGVWVGDIDEDGCPDIMGNHYTGGVSYLSIFFGQDCALGADETTGETSNSLRVSGNTALIRLVRPGRFSVFDAAGRKIKEQSLERGQHSLVWDAGLTRGVYLLVLESGDRISVSAIK